MEKLATSIQTSGHTGRQGDILSILAWQRDLSKNTPILFETIHVGKYFVKTRGDGDEGPTE